jgi:release factor glutamine methyltransferase
MADINDGISGWVASLDGESGRRLQRVLASLPLAVLAKYPPPKAGGLPLGRELSILARRVRGRSVQLHPSGLSGAYSALAPAEHELLYRAFTLGQTMPRESWRSILGAAELESWTARGLLSDENGVLRAAFRIVCLDGLWLVSDAFAQQRQFRNRVHIGKDTAVLLDVLPEQAGGRYLDVGTGSGALLLAVGRRHREAVGVDINPRAVAIAEFNAKLNGIRSTVVNGDLFELTGLGRFDLVTWNLPFHFLPTEERADNIDGDGGEMGIELTLRFVDRLPSLLSESGCAYLLTSSPTLFDGTEPFIRAMVDRAPRLRFDVHVAFIHGLWSPARRRFHREHGIRRIDNVVIEIRRGTGRLERVAAPLVQQAIDWVQGMRYGVPGQPG